MRICACYSLQLVLSWTLSFTFVVCIIWRSTSYQCFQCDCDWQSYECWFGVSLLFFASCDILRYEYVSSMVMFALMIWSNLYFVLSTMFAEWCCNLMLMSLILEVQISSSFDLEWLRYYCSMILVDSNKRVGIIQYYVCRPITLWLILRLFLNLVLWLTITKCKANYTCVSVSLVYSVYSTNEFVLVYEHVGEKFSRFEWILIA